MTVYITRHGQISNESGYLGDVNYPKGDMPLSEMGREQARLLGKRLKAVGFCGKIFTSPYMRTRETASIIAEQVGAEQIIPLPELSEINRSEEKYEDVRYRVALAMQKIMADGCSDVLIVSHGSPISAIFHYLYGKCHTKPTANCAFSVFDTKTKSGVINCVKHLPYEMITQNAIYLKDKPVEMNLPYELLSSRETKILHISDTCSRTYYWYKALFSALKPDVIIHTGDTADEIKVGRIDGLREEYTDRVRHLLNAMTDSCDRVYWTSGNNDLSEVISSIAQAVNIVGSDSVIEICGKRFCVAHDKKDFTQDADFYLYGHSVRYEVWSDERNSSDAPVWYLNGMRAPSVITLPSRKLYKLETPPEW